MESYKTRLKQITTILLQEEENYGEIKQAADCLFDLFIETSKLEENNTENREDIYLPKGKAIGPVWAGMCVKEMMRTKRFVCGIFKAVKAALERFPNETLQILYAGTGPFATLVMPLITMFSSREIQFTLLEINPHSIQSLEKIIKAFEAEEYVSEIIQCDAALYKSNNNRPFHIIISETMQNALKKEPQVAITMNLLPQLNEDGIFIPQNIIIEAGLIDTKRDTERVMGVKEAQFDYYYPLRKIFEVTKDNMERYSGDYRSNDKIYYFPKVEISIGEDIPLRYKSLSLLTTIQVFEDEKLEYMQCSLTMPKKVMDRDKIKSFSSKLNFQYVINEEPGFMYNIIGGEDLEESDF